MPPRHQKRALKGTIESARLPPCTSKSASPFPSTQQPARLADIMASWGLRAGRALLSRGASAAASSGSSFAASAMGPAAGASASAAAPSSTQVLSGMRSAGSLFPASVRGMAGGRARRGRDARRPDAAQAGRMAEERRDLHGRSHVVLGACPPVSRDRRPSLRSRGPLEAGPRRRRATLSSMHSHWTLLQ